MYFYLFLLVSYKRPNEVSGISIDPPLCKDGILPFRMVFSKLLFDQVDISVYHFGNWLFSTVVYLRISTAEKHTGMGNSKLNPFKSRKTTISSTWLIR